MNVLVWVLACASSVISSVHTHGIYVYLSNLWKISIFRDGWYFSGVHMQSLYSMVHAKVASGMIKHKIISNKT